MSRALIDEKEMQLIYDKARDVFDNKYSVQYALLSLKGKTSGTEVSLKMYFNIYKCMRIGKCYKMGTSETFTRFLLNSIFRDFGIDTYMKALSAVKGNFEYRESVNNAQHGLIRACETSISECGVSIRWEEIISSYYKNFDGDSSRIQEKNNTKMSKEGEEKMKDVELTSDDSIGMLLPDYLVETETGDVFELNIQPAASILNVFSRLSYKPWYAIAEFVDNSTQSYISHMTELDASSGFDKLVVKVKYDQVTNILTIIDNAYGMEIERFRDAILLDSRNSTQSGRNEFGMGLKTAASWFGNAWTVTSTQLGSGHRYSATVDIPKLKEQNLNNVQIYRDHVAKDVHGTEVVIEQVTKRITGSRTIGKIRDLLSSMYRRDINRRNIEIWFNDEPIVFDEYQILTNFRGKSWKKNLDFDVIFAGKTYHVTGFVAIMNPGSFPKAGFALFRQDRVVVGGDDSNYKPSQIFGQAQSQRSLKLFGELNMNDFPVNQAKDGFIWDDGLEDSFIQVLKDNIQEYVEIANMSIKERANESQYSEEASEELEHDVSQALNNAFSGYQQETNSQSNETFENPRGQESTEKYGEQNNESQECNPPESSNEVQEYIDTVLHSEKEEQLVGTKRNYKVSISPVLSVEFSVQWAIGSKNFWIEYEEILQDSYNVLINIDHPFFMPYSKDETFKRVLEKFTLSFILAERLAKLSSDRQGYIPTNVIKNYMNKYLQKLAED